MVSKKSKIDFILNLMQQNIKCIDNEAIKENLTNLVKEVEKINGFKTDK